MTSHLVGRSAEEELIADVVDRARGGGSAALVITGEAGIGKTALLEHAASMAEDLTVLRALGIEAESEVSFSALSELLFPLLHHRFILPERLRTALERALGIGDSGPIERFAPAIATLLVLAEAAERDGPVVALVDDAQWIDTASAETLAFAARRLGTDGVAILLATRSGDGRGFPDRGLERVELTPLGYDDSRRVMARAGAGLVPEVESAILDHAAGNPLALLELPGWLEPGQRAGIESLPAPLPAGGALVEAFSSSLRPLPGPTRDALLLAATSRDGATSVLIPAMASVGLPPTALDEAIDRAIVHLARGRVVFRHPLLRSAAYGSSSTSERRAAHRLLAEVLDPDADVEARAWHLAAAAVGQDDMAAQELVRAAERATERGAPSAAAHALERAGELSTDPSQRDRHLCRAAEAWWSAGAAENAEKVASGLTDAALTPELRWDIRQLEARLEMWRGHPAESVRLLTRLAEDVAADAPARAALLHTEAAMACFMVGNVSGAKTSARNAVAMSEGQSEPVRLATNAALVEALILAGEGAEAKPILAQVAQTLCDSGPMFGVAYSLMGYTLLWVEEYELARRLLALVIDRARRKGAVATLPVILASQAHLEMRVGRFDAASAVAAESYELAHATGQLTELAFSCVTLGETEALTGDVPAARRHLDEATRIGSDYGVGSVDVYAGRALGGLELALGQPETAIEALERAAGLMRWQDAREPATIPWAPDLIEAYVRAGRLDEATVVLEEFEDRGRTTSAPIWFGAAAARARGLLCRLDAVDEVFARAIPWHERSPNRFERARTELCWGERLRRAGRRIDAREHLSKAIAGFDASGATLWAERARRELAATGQRMISRPLDEPERLTPQESQITTLVAQGATNREVAAALFISTKTVEYHLRKVFLKLGGPLTQRARAPRPWGGRRRRHVVTTFAQQSRHSRNLTEPGTVPGVVAMRYALTGATGFVGGVLARQLVEAGHDVRALVRDPVPAGDLAGLGVQLVTGDLGDASALDALCDGAEGVFHVAGWYRIGSRHPEEGWAVNVDGTRDTLAAAARAGVDRIVSTGTLAVNSDTHGRVVDETYRFTGRHLSAYDETKAAAHEITAAMAAIGLPVVMVQPGVVYGPGDTSQTGALIGDVVTGGRPPVPSGGGYCWSYVDDIARGHVLAMERGRAGESYMLAGPRATLGEALQTAAGLAGTKGPRVVPRAAVRAAAGLTGAVEGIVPLPKGLAAESMRTALATYLGSPAKAEQELGWTCRGLHEGMSLTVAALRTA